MCGWTSASDVIRVPVRLSSWRVLPRLSVSHYLQRETGEIPPIPPPSNFKKGRFCVWVLFAHIIILRRSVLLEELIVVEMTSKFLPLLYQNIQHCVKSSSLFHRLFHQMSFQYYPLIHASISQIVPSLTFLRLQFCMHVLPPPCVPNISPVSSSMTYSY
jgi:hypothetical protein